MNGVLGCGMIKKMFDVLLDININELLKFLKNSYIFCLMIYIKISYNEEISEKRKLEIWMIKEIYLNSKFGIK